MRKLEITFNRERELKSIAILLLKQLDSTLLAKDRIVFLRLLIRFGCRRFSVKSLSSLGEIIEIHPIALKKSLKNLLEKKLCIEDGDRSIRLKVGLVQGVSYQRTGRTKVQWSAELNCNIKFKLAAFLVKLLDILFQITISHKQKNTDNSVGINYQQWLVLINMVMLSDRSGVVHGAGTYELSNRTGMNRDALLRAITALFNLGIIRSKIHGTLNNNLLKSTDAIYFLNLSSSIWEDKRIYGDFYLVKQPQECGFLVSQAFEIIDSFNSIEIDQDSTLEIISAIVETSLDCKPRDAKLIKDLIATFCFHNRYKKNFYLDMKLLNSSCKYDKSIINSLEKNALRLDFLLHSLIFSVLPCTLKYFELLNLSQKYGEYQAFFKKHLRQVEVNRSDFLAPKKNILKKEEDALSDSVPLVKDWFPMVKSTFEMSRIDVLCVISSAILHREILPVLRLISTENGEEYKFNNIVCWPAGHEKKCQKILYSPNKFLEKDNFHLVDFKKEEGDQKLYEMVSQKVELSFDEQKDYGLLSSKE